MLPLQFYIAELVRNEYVRNNGNLDQCPSHAVVQDKSSQLYVVEGRDCWGPEQS